MPSHAALAENAITFKPDMQVEKALKELKKKKLEHAVVLNEDGTADGIFSITALMKNLLPVSVAMADGIQLDVTVRAAPGIAKRLKKVGPLTVAELMERKFDVVYPETPIWEAVNFLVNSNAPILVVDAQSQKYLGLITPQSALDELNRLHESES